MSSLRKRFLPYIAASVLSLQLNPIINQNAKAQTDRDKDGLPRSRVQGGNYNGLPEWIKDAANFDIDFGIKYPGDWWDIGAYEFYPGRYPEMPLLHNPLATHVSALSSPSSLRIAYSFNDESISQYVVPAKIKPLAVSGLQERLETLAQLSKGLPEDQYFQGLRDYFVEGCKAKFFFDSRNNLFAFYYNGTLGGKSIQIADFPQTSGLQGSEYVKTIEDLTFGTNWFEAKFSADEKPNLKFVLNGGFYDWFFLPDSSKKIKLDYGLSFFSSALINDEAVQRVLTGTSTDSERDSVNRALESVVNGTASTNLANNVSLSFEKIYFGNSGYELYLEMSDAIINRMSIK